MGAEGHGLGSRGTCGEYGSAVSLCFCLCAELLFVVIAVRWWLWRGVRVCSAVAESTKASPSCFLDFQTVCAWGVFSVYELLSSTSHFGFDEQYRILQ